MSIWNNIGEFFLFRWLFSKRATHRRGNETISTDYDNYYGYYDEADDIDDLDISMRNNSVREYGNMSHRNVNYNNYHDWTGENYDQSFDDFHEEQDDYDMMEEY